MKIYRSREGKIFGVCQGLADATGFSVRYWRIGVVLAAIFTMRWTASAYLIAALILPVERPDRYNSKGFKEKFEDLKDDVESFIKREYKEFKEAGQEASKRQKKRKASEPEEEKESKIDPEKA